MRRRHLLRACRLVAAAALATGLAAGLAFGPTAPARATGAATPVDGTYRAAGGHVMQVTGSLQGGFTVTAGESWTINKICTVPAGTLLERFTPIGNSKFEVRWLNVWVPMNPDAPGAKCDFVFDGGPITVTVAATAKTLTFKDCGGDACVLSGTALTRTGSTPTKPTTPTPKPSAAGKLEIELHSMPKRYGTDGNKDRLVDSYRTRAEIDPEYWAAEVYVHRPGGDCDPAAAYAWHVDGKIVALQPTKTSCVFSFDRFKGLGKHTIGVVATKDGVQEKGSGTIVLKDFLIVGIGDSVGSGEGNPDFGAWGFNPTWVDYRCDRSHFSYQARVAAMLEQSSDYTSVTFVHLSCSGAQVFKGLLGGYGGLNDPGGKPLPAQLAQLKSVIGTRKIDAVLLSIGANDVGFGPIVAFCIVQKYCDNSRGFDAKQPKAYLDDIVAANVRDLPRRYKALAQQFTRYKIDNRRVYITEYFDPTHDGTKTCDPLLSIPTPTVIAKILGAPTGVITQAEAQWAYKAVIAPINKAIDGTGKLGWNVVSGVQGAFQAHGYCAAESWVVGLREALWKQGAGWYALKKIPFIQRWIHTPLAEAGALHPNALGHQRIGEMTMAKLEQVDACVKQVVSTGFPYRRC